MGYLFEPQKLHGDWTGDNSAIIQTTNHIL